jgi:hypothetical protein
MNPTTLRDKRVLTTVECHRLMGRGDFERCVQAGWIEPCAQMPTATGSRARFALADVERCEARIIAGVTPEPLSRKLIPRVAGSGKPMEDQAS